MYILETNSLRLMSKIKDIFTGEVFFALFILAGNFKSSLAFISDFIDLTILFLGISIIIALKRLIVKSTILYGAIKGTVLFSVLIILILGSIFYTPSSIYVIDKSLRFLVITGWAYLGVFFLIKSSVSLKKFLNTIVSIGFIMSCLAIYQLIFVQKESFSFISVMGSNYLALGSTVGISIIILNFLYFVNEKNSNKTLFFIFIILQMTIALLISGGRMPLLSLIIVFTFYFAFSLISITKNIYIRKGIKKLALLILFLSPLIIILGKIGMFDVVLIRLSELFKSIDSDTSALGRLNRYMVALDMWGKKPLIGNGIGSFSLFYNGVDMRDYPHNIFLEILSELGIVGFVVFFLLIINSLYNGWILFKKKFKAIDSLQMTLILAFLYLFINANVSGDINDNRLMFTFISLLSISPFMERKEGGSNENMYINNRS